MLGLLLVGAATVRIAVPAPSATSADSVAKMLNLDSPRFLGGLPQTSVI